RMCRQKYSSTDRARSSALISHSTRSSSSRMSRYRASYSASLSRLSPTPVTNGAIVIHTQRLKSDPGGNLLS
ncbi:hypothetical protein C6A50_25980, partial [Escherichia coli]